MPEAKNVTYFKTPAELRKWFRGNHAKAAELWVGFHKRDSGRPSITWPESVDEALCVGWIDGIRKSLGEHSYVIRFTPRRPGSIWSAVNIRRVDFLKKEKRMRPAGLAAYAKRKENKSGIYAYEQRQARLEEPYASLFKEHAEAARFFDAQPPWYRKTISWWIVSAKKEETRLMRLQKLIDSSAKGEAAPVIYVALLRGINVGGNKMVAMADLRDALAKMGFTGVATILQSGNAVFEGAASKTDKLEALLEKEMAKRLGVAADFHVRTADEWKRIVAANPFTAEAKKDPGRLHVSCFKMPLDKARVKQLQAAIKGPERVHADGRQLYMTFPDGMGNSKAAPLVEKVLATRGTARNWNTVLKLSQLAAR